MALSASALDITLRFRDAPDPATGIDSGCRHAARLGTSNR